MSKVKYSNNHVWLREDSDGVVTVGITPFAQESLGDIVFIQMPAKGAVIAEGDEAAVIESVKVASALVMPAAGIIEEVNSTLEAEPFTVNADPLRSGWFFKLRLNQSSILDEMMDEAQYKQFTGMT